MTNPELFFAMLLSRRRAIGQSARTRTKAVKFNGVVWLYPHGPERQYKKLISTHMRAYTIIVQNAVRDFYSGWLKELQSDSYLHVDDFGSEWAEVNRQLREVQQLQFGQNKDGLSAAIFQIGNSVQAFNQKQMDKFVKIALGQSFRVDEPWLQPMLKTWETRNFELMRSLSDDYIKKINGIVVEGVQNGILAADLARDIRKAGKNITGPRSRLIARDQVGKLNGMLTQRRQEDSGIDAYTWVTAGDERVRGTPGGAFAKAIPSHFAINRKLCRWDNSMVYSTDKGKTWISRGAIMPKVHPGIAIQCRCIAIPFFFDMVGRADLQIGRENL